jgi:hypothetical protein
MLEEVCLGHVIRMDHTKVVKDVFQSKTESGRKVGRPRLRSLEVVEDFLREQGTASFRNSGAHVPIYTTSYPEDRNTDDNLKSQEFTEGLRFVRTSIICITYLLTYLWS